MIYKVNTIITTKGSILKYEVGFIQNFQTTGDKPYFPV